MHWKYFGKLYIAQLLLLNIIGVGCIGYMLIEEYTFLEAIYMTLITVSSVGFNEVHSLSDNGRIFTIFLILTSFGTFAFAISSITRYMLDGEFRKYFAQNKSKKKMSKLNNHVIVCGFGRNGGRAIQSLIVHNQSFVIIENEPEKIKRAQEEGHENIIKGDSTRDSVLHAANIQNAKALITTFPKDADNLFVVLTAREINPRLNIICSAAEDNSVRKLKIAGADNVIMPSKVGGAHMASLVLTPDIVQFLDHISLEGDAEVNLEEISFKELPEDFGYKTLGEIETRFKTGTSIIGFKSSDGEFIINPGASTELLPNSKMFVLGNPDQIKQLNDIFGLKKHV